MKSFSDWRESVFSSFDREQTWGIVHELKPILVPRLKKVIDGFVREHIRNNDPKHMRVAVSQILLDLSREYD